MAKFGKFQKGKFQGFYGTQIYEKFRENEAEFNQAKQQINPLEVYTLYTDGASKGNPGDSCVGYIVCDPQGNEFYSNSLTISPSTNNVAEYYGVILA